MGSFHVRVDGHIMPAWPHRRAAELVKLLALSDRHVLQRDQVMEALWPDLDPAAAAGNFRKALHFARGSLGSNDAIRSAGGSLELWPRGDLSVDVHLFEQAARAALASGDETACAQAATLWTGELLPEDRYASWADEPRERLRLLAIAIFKAASLWERVLDVDPADEEAHRELMQQAVGSGDRGGAIRQFERLRARLRADLGLGPDRASVALYEKALAMEGDEPPTAAQRLRAQLAWGLVHLNTGDLDEAERIAREARSLAIDANLGRELGDACALLGMLANMQGRWRELFRNEFVVAVSASPEMGSFVFDSHLCLAEFVMCGPTSYDECVSYARELLDIAEESRSIQGRALAELLLGEADLFADRLDTAEEHLNASEKLHDEANARSGQALALQHLADLALARGRRTDATRFLQRGLKIAETNELAHHLVVRMHGGLVSSASNRSSLDRIEAADADLARGTTCPTCSMGFRVAAVMALARAGRLDQARRRLDDAERLAGMWPGGPWHAAVWEARGVLRHAEGNETQAVAFFKEAAERFAEAGRPRDEARCRSFVDSMGGDR